MRTSCADLRGRTRAVRMALAAAVLLAHGCTTLTPQTSRVALHPPAALLASDIDHCRTGWAPAAVGDALEAHRITLVNWNLQKGGHDAWAVQLRALAAGADVLTLQEAPVNNAGWRDYVSTHHHAFAPGWVSRRTQTGVMTVSRTTPIVQCNLQAREPWLRSPKAVLATEYRLSGHEATLLVVNVHAVNFSLGLAAFDDQLSQVHAIVAQHRGPVILSGDFNTWRRGRLNRLLDLVARHELETVEFGRDTRKRFLGQPLDHVYVRGLRVIDATTYDTDSSDHNPMRVWLSAS